MNQLQAGRSWMQHLRPWSMIATLLCALPLNAVAEPVAAHHLEGTVHGYLMLKTEDGHVLAAGDLLQVARGDRVTAHMIFHFKDGSVDDETTVFSQRGTFHLISDHHVQKGPFFPHPADLSIDTRSGEVTSKSTGNDGKEQVITNHMDMPPDLYNGMISAITKNLKPSGPDETVAMIVGTPKPRLIKLTISSRGEENFSLAGFERKAQHFEIKIQLGGVAGVVAPLVGKQPPNIQMWIEGGEIPGFVGEEGQLGEDSPIVRIEQTGPALPDAAHDSGAHTGTGN